MRLELLEELERFLIGERDAGVRASVAGAQAALDAANSRDFEAIRAAIRNGKGRDVFAPYRATAVGEHAEYDVLDAIVAGVFQFDEPAPQSAATTSEMVFYQPTPARHIFDLIDRTRLGADDVLVDLGSGLGHVTLLAAACTAARCVGIEIEPAYVDCARRVAAALNLRRATFDTEDARTADLGEGTVFYLYTPFGGALLRAVLDRLREQARSRPIRVCTFGPCAEVVAAERWLVSGSQPTPNRITAFTSA